jgi:hypothetical protein
MKTLAGERLVWGHLLTTRGWILGAIRLPGRQTLLRYLNGSGRLVHLAEVASGWWRPGAAPLSIAKAHLHLIVPQAEERVAPSPARGRGVQHLATILLAQGQLTGIFDVRRGTSPARFLEQAPRFVVVERSRLRFPSSQLSRGGMVRSAVVNVGAIVAVSSRLPTGD